MVEQIVGNLIDNAQKYSRDATDPRIVLRATDANGRLAIEVEDRGPGADRNIQSDAGATLVLVLDEAVGFFFSRPRVVGFDDGVIERGAIRQDAACRRYGDLAGLQQRGIEGQSGKAECVKLPRLQRTAHGRFEEAISSLSATIHLLNARLTSSNMPARIVSAEASDKAA